MYTYICICACIHNIKMEGTLPTMFFIKAPRFRSLIFIQMTLK